MDSNYYCQLALRLWSGKVTYIISYKKLFRSSKSQDTTQKLQNQDIEDNNKKVNLF
ncbi:hypothetical protein GW891_04625 [bacterium]|nr:hypothetical protein [bacterium]